MKKYIIHVDPALQFDRNEGILEVEIRPNGTARVVIKGQLAGEVNGDERIASDAIMTVDDFNRYIKPAIREII